MNIMNFHKKMARYGLKEEFKVPKAEGKGQKRKTNQMGED